MAGLLSILPFLVALDADFRIRLEVDEMDAGVALREDVAEVTAEEVDEFGYGVLRLRFPRTRIGVRSIPDVCCKWALCR